MSSWEALGFDWCRQTLETMQCCILCIPIFGVEFGGPVLWPVSACEWKKIVLTSLTIRENHAFLSPGASPRWGDFSQHIKAPRFPLGAGPNIFPFSLFPPFPPPPLSSFSCYYWPSYVGEVQIPQERKRKKKKLPNRNQEPKNQSQTFISVTLWEKL